MKKRILSLFCALALCLTLLPTVVFAATDTGKAIQLVDSGTAANISGAQADNIYFGNYFQSNSTTKEPVKWRVLSNSDGKQLFLLSDQNLDVKPYNSSDTSITWEKSTIRSWLNGYAASENNSGTDYSSNNFIDAAFSSDEQIAVADTYVYNKTQSNGTSNPNPSYNTSGGENTTDKIFLLSIEEANNSSYFPNGSNSRKSTNTAYVASYSGMYGVGKVDYWWLRSPGPSDINAAYVGGSGDVLNYGRPVAYTTIAVRPAFHLDLNSVLFTSAAAGGKAGNGLNAVADYDGNEWKLTLLDNSRNFSISDAKTNGSGDTIVFSYSDAQTGTNEYISVVIEDNGAITYYGRILQPESASGTASLTLPAGVTLGDTTKLYVFNEQYNGGENDNSKLTDYGSELIEVNPTVDDTAPTLSNGSATRDSETSATVKFTSDEAGEYYYAVVASGVTEPTDIVSGDSTNMASGENTINLTNLTAGAKDIYIVAKDAVENVSQTLQIVIPEFIPTYTISASPAALNFSNKTVGYTEAPDGQTVTITNTGNQTVTVTLPTSTNYTITAGTGFANGTATLALNGTANFTIQPKTGLAVGSYSETLTISSDHDTSAEVSLAFTVDPKSLDGAQVQVSGSYIYDGNAKEPSGENVTVTLHGEPLTENTDYTLSYEDNTDAGEATVKVSGTGNYSGTVTGTFQIAKATPTVSDVAVSSPATIYASTDISTITLTHGADDTPGTVKLDDGQTLSVGEDSYNWIFIPNDGNNYETTTGSIRLTVYEPPQEVDGVYQIDSVTDLFWFAGLVNGTLTDGTEQNTSASAVLTADIDLSGETWTPIGSESTPYIGTFDGQGYTISGMTIENAESYSGLFGNVTGTVKNFTVTGSITITGDETVARVGGAVGSLGTASAGGTVSGVTSGVDITVSAGNDHIGGVVGSMPENSSPTVENCIYTGKITVTAAAGSVAGIVGYIRTGTIQNCANQGSISVDVGGTGSVGGILGYCNNGGIYIRNCYNTGAISADGTDNVGAIVGQNKGTQATVSNCYYLTGSANQGQGQLTTDAAGTVVKTADEFASGEVTYLLNGSTSEDLTWYQNLGDDGDQYPVLDSSHGVVYQVENGYSNQNGHVFDDNGFCTEPDCGMYQPAAWNEAKGCYEISNAGQLFWFAALVNGDKTHAEFEKQNLSAGAVLTADITIPSDESGTYNWTPIGNYSANGSLRYNGTFDGAGHTISGLKIDNAQMHCQGFVGYLDDDGTILNLTMDETCSVIGRGSVGGVCSYNYGTITNCSNSGTVIGGGGVGGVCGDSYGTITNCSNTGAVTANNDHGGGVCGYVKNGATVQNCSNSGTVIGGRTVGGVCGYVKNGAIIQNCSNTGAVTGKVSVGGVCGYNYGNITNCYNTGTVIGKFYVGGVIGQASNNGTVQNCYYLDTSHNTGIGSGRFEVTAKTAQQFGSGEVCYLLNGSTSEGDLVWYQNLDNGQRVDSCPVLDNTHGTVYCIEADPVFYSNDPEGEPVQIIRVDIIWGALSYTYQEATWNANTHTYDGAGWTVDDEAGNAITVANNGTLPVTVSYAYQAVENGISGSFADGDDKPVSGPVALPAWDSTTVWLLLEGKPERALDQATIGGVTVTIGGE